MSDGFSISHLQPAQFDATRSHYTLRPQVKPPWRGQGVTAAAPPTPPVGPTSIFAMEPHQLDATRAVYHRAPVTSESGPLPGFTKANRGDGPAPLPKRRPPALTSTELTDRFIQNLNAGIRPAWPSQYRMPVR